MLKRRYRSYSSTGRIQIMATITELVPNLFRLELGRYQAYLWRDGDAATLVDTGELGSGPAIAEALHRIGLSEQSLERVVLTHHHDDHAGSAAEVASWGVPVVAHAADAPVIRGDQAGEPPNFTEFELTLHAQVASGLQPAPPVKVDVEVRNGDVLDFAGGVEVIATPGHTDGSIALYFRKHSILITGDIAAEHEGEVILGVFNLDTDVAAQSFRRLADLEPTTACFGHGLPILTGAAARIRQTAIQLV